MATNDVWRLSIVGDHSGTELAIVTAHFRMKTNVGTFAGLAAALFTDMPYVWNAATSNTFYWRQINGLTENLTPPLSGTDTTGMPLQGGLGSDAAPHQIAIICSLKTAYAGRSYRGRMYTSGWTEDAFTAGLVAAATKTLLQNNMNSLVAKYGAGGTDPNYEWGIWSQKLNIFTPITSAIVRDIPGVIRRRRVGVGV